MELKPEVKEKIDMIVNEFLETLNQDDIDNIKISDIILVGSNVSYNYTSNSDIDIHIRIDLSIYDEPEQRNIMSRLVSAYAKV
ncbi:MAG: hypothetical protein J6W64_04030 [Bacilli bacterium]|nr:hypothetical protein [Bacilli bacterium]